MWTLCYSLNNNKLLTNTQLSELSELSEQHGLLSLQLLWSQQAHMPVPRGAGGWEARRRTTERDARPRQDQEGEQVTWGPRRLHEHLQGAQDRQDQEGEQVTWGPRRLHEHLQGVQGRHGQEAPQDLFSVWRERTQLAHVLKRLYPLFSSEVILFRRIDRR